MYKKVHNLWALDRRRAVVRLTLSCRAADVRVDGGYLNGEGSSINNRLNVHAKEFTMQAGDIIKTSR